MSLKLAIFDLDGTILDTLADLANAVNYVCQYYNRPIHTQEEIRLMIGDGARLLVKRALGESEDSPLCDEALALFKKHYNENINIHTAPYDGIINMLRRLREHGLKIAVNSNKYDQATKALCAHHFPGLLDMVLGENAAMQKKPAPDGANAIMQAFDVTGTETAYIGDSLTDIQTAHNARVMSVWVSWGLRKAGEISIPDHVLRADTPDAVADILLNA